MVAKASELEQIINRYRQELEKMGIHVEKILLFGSQANGTATEGTCAYGDENGVGQVNAGEDIKIPH